MMVRLVTPLKHLQTLVLLFLIPLTVCVVQGKESVEAASPKGCVTCSLAVSPNPVPVGSEFVVFSGSGFPANTTVLLNTSLIPTPEATTDANGSFSLEYGGYASSGPGTARIDAYIFGGRDWVLQASISFSIVDMDSDGDGFLNPVESHVETDPSRSCASSAADLNSNGTSKVWPGDLYATGVSYNKIDIRDVLSYLSPTRVLDTDVTSASLRWDVAPGKGSFASDINIEDLTSLTTVDPPMFDGARAFDHAPCR
jgi:hypothetical protein